MTKPPGMVARDALRADCDLRLDEALKESFPASDPVAVGHSEHAGTPSGHESSNQVGRQPAASDKELSMGPDTRLVLTSFQDGRAVVEVHYANRHARLELDQLEDRYAGQPTAERAGEEIAALVKALGAWLHDPASRIEQA